MELEILSQADGWSEFGLAGLVIGALFSGLFFMGRWLASFVSKVADVHFKEREEWKCWGSEQLDLHRVEREDWKKQIAENSLAHRTAMGKLTDAVNNLVEEKT